MVQHNGHPLSLLTVNLDPRHGTASKQNTTSQISNTKHPAAYSIENKLHSFDFLWYNKSWYSCTDSRRRLAIEWWITC